MQNENSLDAILHVSPNHKSVYLNGLIPDTTDLS